MIHLFVPPIEGLEVLLWGVLSIVRNAFLVCDIEYYSNSQLKIDKLLIKKLSIKVYHSAPWIKSESIFHVSVSLIY